MKKYSIKKLVFVSCEVTNTRLMGVVGVDSVWRDINGNTIHYLFHLDYEDYGIDGTSYLMNESESVIDYEIKKMMGGLGGLLVGVSYEELGVLLLEAYHVNIIRCANVPEEALPWVERFQIELGKCVKCEKSLYNKICEKHFTDFQLVNYSIMRTIGKDKACFDYLVNGVVKYVDVVQEPSMLLKSSINTISEELSLRVYCVTSLVYVEDNYKIYHWIISIDNNDGYRKIETFELTDSMRVSSFEAALLLRKKEYIQVYEVVDVDMLQKKFDEYSKGIMINNHLNGDLYTVFQTHNNHVKDQNYYLNGDIYVIFFISNSGELIVSSFDENSFEEVIADLDSKEYDRIIIRKNAYQMNQSVIYEYVHSNCESFEEFIEMYV